MVVLLCRQHAGESPSSFVCQGLIDFLVSNHEVARELRERVVFKVLPMMNPDGVFLGNTRGNLLGQDLNRNGTEPDPHAHPTVCAAKKLIEGILDGGGEDGEESQEGELELDTVLGE